MKRRPKSRAWLFGISLFLASCGLSGPSDEEINKAMKVIVEGWTSTLRYVSIGLKRTGENTGNMDYTNVDNTLHHTLAVAVNGDVMKVSGTCRFNQYYDEEAGYELNGALDYELWYTSQRPDGYGTMKCKMELAGGPVDTMIFHLKQTPDGRFEKADLNANGRQISMRDPDSLLRLLNSLVSK